MAITLTPGGMISHLNSNHGPGWGVGGGVGSHLRLAQSQLDHLHRLAQQVGLLMHQVGLLVLLQALDGLQQAVQDGVVLVLQRLQPLDHQLGVGDDLLLGELLQLLLSRVHHGGHRLAASSETHLRGGYRGLEYQSLQR